MWKFELTLLIILGAAEFCISCEDLELCFEALNKDFESLDGALPTKDELRRMCPLLRESFQCFHKGIELCTGMTTAERAELKDNKIASNAAQTLLSIENIAKDLCNEKSSLHRSYVQSVTCANEYFADQEHHCRRKGEIEYDAYKKFLESLPEENDKEIPKNSECLIQAFALTCISEDLDNICGKVAQATFMEIVQESRYLRYYYCSESDIQELKSRFLESSELKKNAGLLYLWYLT